MNWLETLIKKISNQSTLIVLIPLGYSYFALKGQSSYLSGLAITGFISFGIGVFLLLGNFFVNQIGEGYKSVIGELKGVINALKSQNKFVQQQYKDQFSTQTSGLSKTLEDAGYKTQEGSESTTTV